MYQFSIPHLKVTYNLSHRALVLFINDTTIDLQRSKSSKEKTELLYERSGYIAALLYGEKA